MYHCRMAFRFLSGKVMPQSCRASSRVHKTGGARPGSRSKRHTIREGAAMRNERSTSATEAKNRFGEVLKAAEKGPVFIEKRGRYQAVVLALDDYQSLLARNRTPDEARLDTLRKEFDKLYERMQSKRSRSATDRLLAATQRSTGPSPRVTERGRIFVAAGTNGAGKSSIAGQFIAREGGAYYPGRAHARAGGGRARARGGRARRPSW